MRSPPNLLGGGLPGLHKLYYHFAISLSLSFRLPAGLEGLLGLPAQSGAIKRVGKP